MKNVLGITAMSVALVVMAAGPAAAQYPVPNGVGLSVGGGPARFRSGADDPRVSLIRPEDDRLGVLDLGLFLGWGNRRWALLFPEVHYVPMVLDTENADGSVTLGSRTVTFTPSHRSLHTVALMIAGQIAIVPTGRVWVRGGIGAGWISSHIATEDQKIGIDLSTDDGLALSGAVGVSVWNRPLGTTTLSLDAEIHYFRIRADQYRVNAPSLRVGVTVMPPASRP